MSLINRMLQDLDARRATHGVGFRLPDDVRPLPPRPPSRWPVFLLALILLLAAVVAATYHWLQLQGAARPQGERGVAVPLAAPPVGQGVTVEKKTETQQNADAAATAAPEIAPALDVEPDASLRMADHLGTEKQSAGPSKPRENAEKPAKSAPSQEKKPPSAQGRPLPSTSKSEKSSEAKATGQPSIARTEVGASAREGVAADYRQAIAEINQGRVAEGLARLQQVLKQDAHYSAARQLQVRLLLEARRVEEAMALLQEGLAIEPAQLNWAMTLARLQMERGEVAAAWKTLAHSLPAADRNADYQGFAGHVLQKLGRNKDSIARYQAATQLAPADGRWWLGLGLGHEAEGRSAEAREAFLRARQGQNLRPELTALLEQKLK